MSHLDPSMRARVRMRRLTILSTRSVPAGPYGYAEEQRQLFCVGGERVPMSAAGDVSVPVAPESLPPCPDCGTPHALGSSQSENVPRPLKCFGCGSLLIVDSVDPRHAESTPQAAVAKGTGALVKAAYLHRRIRSEQVGTTRLWGRNEWRQGKDGPVLFRSYYRLRDQARRGGGITALDRRPYLTAKESQARFWWIAVYGEQDRGLHLFPKHAARTICTSRDTAEELMRQIVKSWDGYPPPHRDRYWIEYSYQPPPWTRRVIWKGIPESTKRLAQRLLREADLM